jgi:hypothetical protein
VKALRNWPTSWLEERLHVLILLGPGLASIYFVWHLPDASASTWFSGLAFSGAVFTYVAKDVYWNIYRAYWPTNASGREQLSQSEPQTVNPPGLAEWLITLLVPNRRAETLLGDFEQRFNRHIETRGLRMARALYWGEVLRSILPLVIVKAKKLGVIAVIAEIWRRSHS